MRIDDLLKEPESLTATYRTLLRDVDFQLVGAELHAVCRSHLEAELLRVVAEGRIRDGLERERSIRNVRVSITPSANDASLSDQDTAKPIAGPAAGHPEYAFDSFLVDETNAGAFVGAVSVVSAEGSVATKGFLYIYGSPGCGKSHLLHATVNELASGGKHVAVFDGQQFAEYLIAAASLTGKARNAHLELIHGADGLAVDDIKPITGNGMQTVQLEFASILDNLDENGKCGIFTGRYSPTDWHWKLVDSLSYRLAGGQLGEIEAPRGLMRGMLAEMCFGRANLNPGRDILSFVADAQITSIRTLLTLCYQLVAQAYSGGDVTVRLAKSLLKKLGVKKGASDEQVVMAALQTMGVAIPLSGMQGRTISRDLKSIRNRVILQLVEDKKLSQSLIAGAFSLSVQSVSKILKEGTKH
jgi:chromosomal replication initiation ATPase DnaA